MNQNEVPRTEWSESDVAAMLDRTWEPMFDHILKKWYVTDGGQVLITMRTGNDFDPTWEKTCRAVCEDHNAAVRARKSEKTCSDRKHAAMRKDGWAKCRDCGQSTLTQEVDAEPPAQKLSPGEAKAFSFNDVKRMLCQACMLNVPGCLESGMDGPKQTHTLNGVTIKCAASEWRCNKDAISKM